MAATVNWGDGNTTDFTNADLSPDGSTALDVVESHTYATDGLVRRYAIETTFYTDDTYTTEIGTVDSPERLSCLL